MAAETKLDTSLLGAASELPLTEEQRLRDTLQANPLDFDSHTALLALIEKGDQPAKLKDEVSQFLRQYPLCYGFWKKLADSEAKVSEAAARAVYEQSVKAFPNGVELWTHYCAHVAFHEEDLAMIRTLFEAGAEAVGSDASSDKFWEKYIEFETAQEEWDLLVQLYQRLVPPPPSPILTLAKHCCLSHLLSQCPSLCFPHLLSQCPSLCLSQCPSLCLSQCPSLCLSTLGPASDPACR